MVYTFTGKNSLALKAAIKSMAQEIVADHGDMALESIDASEVAADVVIQAAQSLPFLAEKKLVIVNYAQSNTELMNRIEELTQRSAESVDLVLVGPVFDKRKKSFNVLKKHTTLKEFKELSPADLPAWIISEAKELGGAISRPDALFLSERVGTDQMLIGNELAKLVAHDESITKESIVKLVDKTTQENVFDMLSAAFSGRAEQAVDKYRQQRKQQVDPQYIVAMMTWQLQSLAQAVFAPNQSEYDLTSAGQSSFAARKSLSMARGISKDKIRQLVNDLADLDLSIKSFAESDAAIELYILKI